MSAVPIVIPRPKGPSVSPSAAFSTQYLQHPVQELRRAGNFRRGENDVKAFPVRIQVMVDEDFTGRRCLEEGGQPLRAGELVAVQLDDEVALLKGILGCGRVDIPIQVLDLGRQDEQEVVRRGVRKDTGDRFAAACKPERQGRAGPQRIPVRVGMPHHGNPCGLLYGPPEAPDVFLTDCFHAHNHLRGQIYKRLLLLRNDFVNFVGSLENYKTLK